MLDAAQGRRGARPCTGPFLRRGTTPIARAVGPSARPRAPRPRRLWRGLPRLGPAARSGGRAEAPAGAAATVPAIAASTIIEEGRLLARVRHPERRHDPRRRADRRARRAMDGARSRPDARRDARRRLRASAQRDVGSDWHRALRRGRRGASPPGCSIATSRRTNVMRGDDGRVVLMDFGTGREHRRRRVRLRWNAAVSGARDLPGPARRRVQSDVYSLGILLHYLATRSRRNRCHPAFRTCARTTGQRLRELRQTVSRKLSRIIERATDPRPERRYPTVDSFGADLAALVKRPSFGPMAYLTAVVAAALLGHLGDPDSRRRTAGASARPPGRCRRPANPRRAAVREHQRRAGQRGIG